MGKWSAFADKFPTLPEDPSRLEAMQAELQALEGRSLADLAGIQDIADQDRKAAEDEASRATLRRDAARLLLAKGIKAAGLESIRANGFTYTPSIEPHAVVVDKAALMAYGMAGHPEVLTYAPGTIKTLLKSFLEGDGDPLPGVDAYMKPTFSRTKSSK